MSDSLRVVTFLLVPDAGAARRVRRLLAERRLGFGVQVGSWSRLIDTAQQAYLIPHTPPLEPEVFEEALASLPEAFWSQSLKVAPIETALEVESALIQVLSAGPVGWHREQEPPPELSERVRRRVTDLFALERALEGRLPTELAALRDLLVADSTEALQWVRVLHIEGVPWLSSWQSALLEKLNRDVPVPEISGRDSALLEILHATLDQPTSTAHPGALGVLQTQLFGEIGQRVPLDPSVQWVGVRDALQEAEIAVGMIQRMLADDPQLRLADIGVLMPDRPEYAWALKDALGIAGLPVAGLELDPGLRDLGREAVLHFLYCRQPPAPMMALAACLSSPLMPWSREDGARLAQKIMDDEYDLKPPQEAGGAGRRMLDLLFGDDRWPSALVQCPAGFPATAQSKRTTVFPSHAGAGGHRSALRGVGKCGRD